MTDTDIIWKGLKPVAKKDDRTNVQVVSTGRKFVKAKKKAARQNSRNAPKRDSSENSKVQTHDDDTTRVRVENSLNFTNEQKISPSKTATSFGIRKQRERNIIPSVSEMVENDATVKVNKKRKRSDSDLYSSPVRKKKTSDGKKQQLFFEDANSFNNVSGGFNSYKLSTSAKKKKIFSKKPNHVELKDPVIENNMKVEVDDFSSAKEKIGRKNKNTNLNTANGVRNGMEKIFKKKRIKKENTGTDINKATKKDGKPYKINGKKMKSITELAESADCVEDKTERKKTKKENAPKDIKKKKEKAAESNKIKKKKMKHVAKLVERADYVEDKTEKVIIKKDNRHKVIKKKNEKADKPNKIKEKKMKSIAELAASADSAEDKTEKLFIEIEVTKSKPLTNENNEAKLKIKKKRSRNEQQKLNSHPTFKIERKDIRSNKEDQNSNKENCALANGKWDISSGVSSDIESWDAENIQVNNLTYKELCGISIVPENESILRHGTQLNIPEEHYNDSEGSECDETSSEKIQADEDKRENITQDSLQSGPHESDLAIEESITANEEVIVEENGEGLNDTQTEAEQVRPMQFLTLENDDKVIILNPDGTIHFYGLFLIEVLQGEVEILGAQLCKNSGIKKVYSPRGTALLYLKNLRPDLKNTEKTLHHVITADLLPPQWREMTVDVNSAVILCKKLKEPYVDFILKHMSQRVFPYESGDSGPRIIFENLPSKVRVGEAWTICDQVTDSTRLAICGGKGVGKSTLLRYTVNKLLKRFPKVKVIDLDPGQSEFFMPGTVSVATVSDYLLGPNYTHHQMIDRAILANINVAYDVKKYVACVEAVLCSSDQEAFPTVINLCGYVTGLGLDVTLEVLRLLDPHLVVQIKSRMPSRNYPIDLTAEEAGLSYDHLTLDSMAEQGDAWKLDGRQSREINTLAYFGRMMSGSVRDLTSCDVNMYSINLASVNITNGDGNSVSPLAVNANLVALCSRRDHALLECHGWGFVRGVDLDSGTMVLLTPESLRVLDRVDHVVLSSVAVPPSLIMSTGDITGHAPYLNPGKPIALGTFTKRPYLPPKKDSTPQK
ncbi:polynucleotide 5'-hydroxyl-kinase NOL9 [Cylas formicarius]|uniref:polynucleotide 5'-hydroxyl-kinase NOL9 n=1 Tax=Cylas formicarius TaxID=197179 RepID=UPI0029586C84|nr:polynucleotide 5'-hydroxyl-kinase NOL9 [Cylas formicarius]